MMSSSRQRKAYDTLKGVIYSLQTSDYVRSILERELDLLYESWYKLAENGSAPIVPAQPRVLED